MVNCKGNEDLAEESNGVLVEAGTLEDDDDWMQVAGTKRPSFPWKSITGGSRLDISYACMVLKIDTHRMARGALMDGGMLATWVASHRLQTLTRDYKP
jgi:hypothetical protein